MSCMAQSKTLWNPIMVEGLEKWFLACDAKKCFKGCEKFLNFR